MATTATHDIERTLTDGFYITVGLGVIAFQKAQMQTQGLIKSLEDGIEDVKAGIAAFESRVMAALDDVEAALPEPAAGALAQARTTTRNARLQLTGQLN